MSGWQGPPVLVGERTLWLGSGSGLPKSAVIRWIGRLPEIGPDWTVGLELDDALPFGGIDGSWGGRVLFTCRPKHGLLVPISRIIPSSQLKHLPNISSGFEKNQNAAEQNAMVSPSKHHESHPQPTIQPEVNLPRPAVRHKRRIPTPPSSDSDDPSSSVAVSKTDTEPATLRVEERDQEDSLKKRLRLFTENNGAIQRMKNYNECAFEEVVIDSLYAQRRQQYAKHGRSQSDSSQAFISSASSSGPRRERSSSAIFSIFRWFRRESRSDDFDPEFAPSAPPSPQLIRGYSSSCGSVDTLFSTATTNSFAFVHPAFYRPFGAANPPEKCIIAGPETETYRNRLRQRDRIRELDKNLTLKKKYHLFGSGTLRRSVDDVNNRHLFLNKSLDSIKVINNPTGSKNSTLGRKKRKAPPPPTLPEEKSKEFSIPITLEQNKENTDINCRTETPASSDNVIRPRHRRTVSDSAKDRKSGAFVHVRGKRKAPPPPVATNSSEEKPVGHEILGTQSLGRKKRHAPPPPLVINREDNDGNNSVSQGMLTPEEKQRLIDNIAKLQVHADRKSLLLATPPASPVMNAKMSHTVCNDSLKLEKGVLKSNKTEVQSSEAKPVTPTTPTPVSPRPWYKRNMGNKEKSLEKKKDHNNIDDWMPEVVIMRGNVINNDTNNGNSTNSSHSSNSCRLSNIFSRFEKPEEKRKSQISMLANISELDREAAEIVQREQEKERAMLAAQDAKYYSPSTVVPDHNLIEPPESEMLPFDDKLSKNADSPKRSGARELISLFNAIGNVTKVTVHSAFFSKEGPSIFSKEGVEKRFSLSGESVKTSEEKVMKESMTKTNGYKRETVFVEEKETYSESPGIKRRRNLIHQDSGSSSSVRSGGDASPRVIIEEIVEDAEKSKTQALYEANKVKKHHSPSPSIPTIAEMSESTSSVTASLRSTTNASERSVSVTPTPADVAEPSVVVDKGSTGTQETPSTSKPTQSVLVSKSVEVQSGAKQPSKNYSIWSCPRCTLENPRWRVTCEACDMWRPAVRKDVIDKLTNTSMGTTIAVNLVKAGDSKNTSAVKRLSSHVDTQVKSNVNVSIATSDPKAQESNKAKVGLSSNDNCVVKTSILKPMTVSGLLNGTSYDLKQHSNVSEKKDSKDLKVISRPTSISSSKESQNIPMVSNNANQVVNLSQQETITQKNLPTNGNERPDAQLKEIKIKEYIPEVVNTKEATNSVSTTESESDIEEVRKARLAFFDKSQSSSIGENNDLKKECSKTSSPINQGKIDALFSIASKGSLATNEEERLKVKEILKEMKNSLPKKSRENKSEAGPSKLDTKTEINIIEKENTKISPTSSNAAAVRLGAIKKSKAQNPILSSHTKGAISEKSKDDKKAEVYLVKSETIIEEIKVKDNSKSSKVSTSVQTSGVVRKVEPSKLTASTANEEGAKTVTGKPPTPKSVRKEVMVPVTVEEHVINDCNVQTTTTQETRKMGIGTFNLIRPRDFANIEATKTGSELKPLHVYVNVPRTHDEDSSSSSSSDSPEVTQLSAELTKPKGLADFKASVLEHGAGNKMNTLAVNRLLRQLEAAIVGGQHLRAATLAKELARHKVNCSVTRHKQSDLFTVDMYVEDRLSHQGPYPVQVSPAMTVAQLKAKVEAQFEMPATVQRWILGKQLAIDDRATLQQLGVTQPHCPVFLYLVAPDGGQDKSSAVGAPRENETPNAGPVSSPETQAEGATGTSAPAHPGGRGWYFNEEDDRYSFCESELTDQSSKDPSPEPRVESSPLPARQPVVEEPDDESEEEEEEKEETGGQIAAAPAAVVEPPATALVGTLTIGWKCTVCTLVNSPTRPGCIACGTARPADYKVPDDYQASGNEQQRLQEEQNAEQAADEEKLKNYRELMVLENADLIASTEAFECSVCLTECEAGDGVVLRDCLHTFCRACLAHTVQFTDEAEVKCPFRDHSYACNSTLQEREIKAVTEEEDDSCIICMAEPRCCALTPCGHRAYCETCCLRLIELDQMCSLCRRKADGYLLIYL